MSEIIKQKYSSPKLEEILGTKFSDVSGTNLSLPVYTKDVKTIKPAFKRDLMGYVEAANPQTAFLTQSGTKQTLGHEAEHAQQLISEYENWKSGSRYDRIADHGPKPYPQKWRNEQVRDELMGAAKKAYSKYEQKYDLSDYFGDMRKEFMADMIGIESTLPLGQSVLDTDIGKEIFDTPEKRRWFLVSSFPNTTKFLEYNPDKYQLAVEKGRQALREFKDRSLHDSYFNAALAAIKKLASK